MRPVVSGPFMTSQEAGSAAEKRCVMVPEEDRGQRGQALRLYSSPKAPPSGDGMIFISGSDKIIAFLSACGS